MAAGRQDLSRHPEAIAGKEVAFRSPEQLETEIRDMYAVLASLWDASAAPAGD